MATVSDVTVAFALGRPVPVRQDAMNGPVIPRCLMTLFRYTAVLALQLVLLAPAIALQFQPNPSTGEILATGTVELDDADRITKLITLEYRQEHRLVRGFVTVNFDSPGGSLLGGLRLGYALRKLTVHTNVGQGQSCFSACALAFLGGQQRTVEGQYGVHAASLQATVAATKSRLATWVAESEGRSFRMYQTEHTVGPNYSPAADLKAQDVFAKLLGAAPAVNTVKDDKGVLKAEEVHSLDGRFSSLYFSNSFLTFPADSQLHAIDAHHSIPHFAVGHAAVTSGLSALP